MVEKSLIFPEGRGEKIGDFFRGRCVERWGARMEE
jgi:hypothetical protein